jgi:arylsulfatase A-like enzyme
MPTPWTVLSLALVLVSGGCDAPADGRGGLRRLSPAAFSVWDRAVHWPNAQIGDESREVLVAPESITIADADDVRVDGVPARISVTILERARVYPDAAFVVDAQRRRTSSEEGAATLWRRLTRWRLVRDPIQSATATLELPAEREPTDLRVRLRALAPMPAVLESRPFDLPSEARLELGYGVVNSPADGSRLEVRFAASLGCADGATQTLHKDRVIVDAAAPPRWHNAVTSALQPRRGCRLRLETEDVGTNGARPVWTAPRIRSPSTGRALPPNLVVISLDTLRADHLSGYGYPRTTSPAIDARLIAAGATFTDVSTVFPLTSNAHLSLFTGLYPDAEPDGQRLDPATPVATLAEVLRDAGYATAGFTGGGFVSATFGFGLGFDRYTERELRVDARGVRTFHDGAAWVAERREPFFLFLHTYKVHAPYVSGARYAPLFADPSEWERAGMDPNVPRDQRATVDAYDRAIRQADDQVAGFLNALDRSGLAARTLVVLLSDHGEAFGEHGVTGHGTAGHEEQLRVPLILRGPGVRPGVRLDATESLIDVVPTLLDLLGQPPLDQAQGRSFRPALDGRADRGHPVYFSWLADDACGVRSGRWKFLAAEGTAQTFDLASDPHERMPIDPAHVTDFGARALVTAQAAENEHRRAALSEAADMDGEARPISEHVEHALRALGYR